MPASDFLESRQGAILACAGYLIVYVVCRLPWKRWLRRADTNAIPLYEPPAGLDAATARALFVGEIEGKALTAAILSMADKGAIDIESTPFGFRIQKAGRSADALSPVEREAYSAMFFNRTMFVTNGTESEALNEGFRVLKNDLAYRLQDSLTLTPLPLALGAAFIIAVLWQAFAAIQGAPYDNGPTLAIILCALHILLRLTTPANQFIAGCFLGGCIVTWIITAGVPTRGRPVLDTVAQVTIFFWSALLLVRSIRSLVRFTGMYGSDQAVLSDLALHGCWLALIVIVALFPAGNVIAVNLCALGMIAACDPLLYLSRAISTEGRKRRVEVMGLRMFMLEVDRPMIAAVGAEVLTAKRYRQLLPYAYALDIEQPWVELFSQSLGEQADTVSLDDRMDDAFPAAFSDQSLGTTLGSSIRASGLPYGARSAYLGGSGKPTSGPRTSATSPRSPSPG